MSKEELEKVCEYIQTHELLGTEIETIFAAIKAVTGRDTAIITTATAKDYQIEKDKAETMDKTGSIQKMEIADLQRIFRAVEKRKQSQFLAENEKLADIKLPEIKPIGNSLYLENLTDSTSKEDVVIPEPIDIEHEFIHPTTKTPEPIFTDEDIAKIASKVVSIRKSDEPVKTGSVIINDYAANRLSNTNNVSNNSELDSMMNNSANQNISTEDSSKLI